MKNNSTFKKLVFFAMFWTLQWKMVGGGIGVGECGLTLEQPLLCNSFPGQE